MVVAMVVNDKPHQVLRLTSSLVRLRASKLRDFQVEFECPRKRTRATVRFVGTISYDRGLGRYGEARISDSVVNIGNCTVFVHNNPSPSWCRCGRNAKRLKEVALLRSWMSALKNLNGHYGVHYGDAV